MKNFESHNSTDFPPWVRVEFEGLTPIWLSKLSYRLVKSALTVLTYSTDGLNNTLIILYYRGSASYAFPFCKWWASSSTQHPTPRKDFTPPATPPGISTSFFSSCHVRESDYGLLIRRQRERTAVCELDGMRINTGVFTCNQGLSCHSLTLYKAPFLSSRQVHSVFQVVRMLNCCMGK